MQQLVKHIVKYSAFFDAHAHDCNVSKAMVNVIRTIVSAECVGIAEKWGVQEKMSSFYGMLK